MTKGMLIAALTTGGFCAVFAALVWYTTSMLAVWHIMLFGGVSGFFGSLFASLVLRRNK